MAGLLLNEKLNSKRTKETKFSVIIELFKRIVKHNKLLFFNCSLLAILTATINFYASFLTDKLVLSNDGRDSHVFWETMQEKRFPFYYFFGKSKDFKLREYVLWLIVYLVIFKATFSVMHWYLTTYCCNKIERDLKIELFEILTSSSYEKSSETSSKMLTQFSSDIDNIAYDIWTVSNRLIYVTVSIVLNIRFIFKGQGKSFEYVLVSVILLLFASLFAVVYLLLRKSTSLSMEAKKRYEANNRFIFERISNLEYIKSASSEGLEMNKLDNHLNDTLKKNQRSLLWTTLFRSIPDYLIIPNIPLLFVWIVTSDFFRDQISSPRVLVVYFFAVRRLNSEVGKIFNSILSLEGLSGNLSVVMDSINFLSTNESSVHEEFETFTSGDITFDKVTFAYPSRIQNNVIEDFSFTFKKGKKYGIAGKNGIGKSTITRILLKLYRGFRGNVLINQKNLLAVNTEQLHHNICKLNNRPSFFNMSIAENIFYPFAYNKDQDLKKLIYAAREARVFKFIKSLPASFDTVLREGGADLSEGQKQQLEAMKVFIKNYEIYMFDEILSNVHPSTRKIILRNIFTKIGDKLVIAIDHHYDIFAHMDYVYTFSSRKLTRVRHPGKLVENEFKAKAPRN